MKIAQIAPLMESVPPRLYGGTERIVSYLTDELVIGEINEPGKSEFLGEALALREPL